MNRNVCVNGRYRVHRVTGMQRYAREVVSRLPAEARVIAPGGWARGIPGHAWEQAVLPWRAAGSVLWSPCSTGPLGCRRHVVTIHDLAFVDQRDCFTRQFSAWYTWLVPRLARRAARVITVSAFSRNRIAEYCRVSRERIVVTPLGVESRFRVLADETVDRVVERKGLSRPYVLSVASLEPRKNLGRLLLAWERLAPRYPDWHLVIAGGTGSVFRGAGLHGVPPRVAMLGYVDDDELVAVYGAAEAFVYPSIYEGFGLPVLEAMACGVPVVCGNATSLPEVAGDAAVLVDPLDVCSIASGVDRVLGDGGLRAELRARGLARSRQFTWENTARQTWAVLQEAAS